MTLGGTDHSIGKPFRGQALDVTVDLHHTVLLANVIGTKKTIALPRQRIRVPALMGARAQFLALPR